VKQFGPQNRRRRRPPDPDFNKFMSDEERRAEELESIKETSLADVGLPVRTVNALEERGCFNVGQLASMERVDLVTIANVGDRTILDCKQRLDKMGVPHPNWNRPPRRRRKKKKR